jgi:predicted AlkP superfamily phosphohydrolase/phosphomutase
MTGRAQERRRVVVLAVSELAPDLVERWIASGHLPNFAWLARRGATGRTRYEIPYYLTPQMWATITTGVSAGRHGLIDYRQRTARGDFRETNGADILAPRFWDALAEAGLRPGVANVPFTYPPRAKSGFVIAGQDAPGDHPSIADPVSVWRDLRAQFGRYHVKDVFPGGQGKAEYAADFIAEIHAQAEVFRALVQRDDWDFLMLYANGAAMAQHYYWGDMAAEDGPFRDVIRSAFQAIDAMLGVIAATAGAATTICVFSECGAGPLAKGVNINAWLKRQGLLAFRSDSDALGGLRRVERRALGTARAFVHKNAPKQLFFAINRPGLRKWIARRRTTNSIDWSRTQVYHHGKGEGSLYFNLAGREPQGVVALEDCEHLATEVTARLLDLETEDGVRPVVAVHRGNQLFQGPHREGAPDLVIEWRDAAYMPSERDLEDDPVFGPRYREYMSWPTSGSHRPEGYFSAAGPGVSASQAGVLGLLDLAPTLLALCGVAAPAAYEGRAAAWARKAAGS